MAPSASRQPPKWLPRLRRRPAAAVSSAARPSAKTPASSAPTLGPRLIRRRGGPGGGSGRRAASLRTGARATASATPAASRPLTLRRTGLPLRTPLLASRFGTRRLAAGPPLRALLCSLLLELLHLLLHELARNRLL